MDRFAAWYGSARPGESFTYHEGNLAGGRYIRSVRQAYNNGFVELVQRRLEQPAGPNSIGKFAYIAQAKAVPRKPLVPFDLDD